MKIALLILGGFILLYVAGFFAAYRMLRADCRRDGKWSKQDRAYALILSTLSWFVFLLNYLESRLEDISDEEKATW